MNLIESLIQDVAGTGCIIKEEIESTPEVQDSMNEFFSLIESLPDRELTRKLENCGMSLYSAGVEKSFERGFKEALKI